MFDLKERPVCEFRGAKNATGAVFEVNAGKLILAIKQSLTSKNILAVILHNKYVYCLSYRGCPVCEGEMVYIQWPDSSCLCFFNPGPQFRN